MLQFIMIVIMMKYLLPTSKKKNHVIFQKTKFLYLKRVPGLNLNLVGILIF